MRNPARLVALCCLIIVLSLYVVGVVSHGVLRHIVQTLPLWPGIVLGFRDRDLRKWMALPCLLCWLIIMVLTWLFLLHLAHVLTGHFTPIEIVLTIIIGIAAIVGLLALPRWRTKTHPAIALVIVLLFAALQYLAIQISFLPSIAHR
jgi:hypothetical protein